MYQAKTTGFLESLMNALSLRTSRGSSVTRRARSLPQRREAAVRPTGRDAFVGLTGKEMYIEAAWLSRWNR